MPIPMNNPASRPTKILKILTPSQSRNIGHEGQTQGEIKGTDIAVETGCQ